MSDDEQQGGNDAVCGFVAEEGRKQQHGTQGEAKQEPKGAACSLVTRAEQNEGREREKRCKGIAAPS